MYSEACAYHDYFKVRASTGDLHRAGCRGWHLSEVDTWHACGKCNGDGSKPHPESEVEEAGNRVPDGYQVLGYHGPEVGWEDEGPFPVRPLTREEAWEIVKGLRRPVQVWKGGEMVWSRGNERAADERYWSAKARAGGA